MYKIKDSTLKRLTNFRKDFREMLPEISFEEIIFFFQEDKGVPTNSRYKKQYIQKRRDIKEWGV